MYYPCQQSNFKIQISSNIRCSVAFFFLSKIIVFGVFFSYMPMYASLIVNKYCLHQLAWYTSYCACYYNHMLSDAWIIMIKIFLLIVILTLKFWLSVEQNRWLYSDLSIGNSSSCRHNFRVRVWTNSWQIHNKSENNILYRKGGFVCSNRSKFLCSSCLSVFAG